MRARPVVDRAYRNYSMKKMVDLRLVSTPALIHVVNNRQVFTYCPKFLTETQISYGKNAIKQGCNAPKTLCVKKAIYLK